MTSSTPNADFDEIYQHHHGEVWALGYARSRNADTATDIMQETFARLLGQLEAGETIWNPRAWLLQTARNLAKDHAKSAFRRNGTSPPDEMFDIQSDEPLPDELAQRREEAAALRVALAKLSDRERSLLEMHYTQEMTTRQISAVTGIPNATVGATLQRARRKLHELLDPSPNTDSDPGLAAAS